MNQEENYPSILPAAVASVAALNAEDLRVIIARCSYRGLDTDLCEVPVEDVANECGLTPQQVTEASARISEQLAWWWL